MREGAEWLQEYLKNKPNTGETVVAGNFPSQWYFRNDKNRTFVYTSYTNRSEYNWDYMLVANSYFSPFQLKNKRWPPNNTIHTIFADGVPVCAVLERLTKDDRAGILALKKGDYINSALLFRNALELDPQNELICYKFAEALLGSGQNQEAEDQLQKCLEINPESEKALALSGDLALKQGDAETASDYFQKAIQANRKYLSVYPKLAGIYAETNAPKARKVLRDCLKIDPKYKPALRAMAETYRKTDPEKAKKIDEQIDKL
jgi:tetratricopeptide (TPR) repeat protein